LARRGLWLEDLFVIPEARGKGYGKALLKHCAKLAVSRGCGRFEWSVLDWNEPSIQFYKAAGATLMDDLTDGGGGARAICARRGVRCFVIQKCERSSHGRDDQFQASGRRVGAGLSRRAEGRQCGAGDGRHPGMVGLERPG